jgi:hypothetical protein
MGQFVGMGLFFGLMWAGIGLISPAAISTIILVSSSIGALFILLGLASWIRIDFDVELITYVDSFVFRHRIPVHQINSLKVSGMFIIFPSKIQELVINYNKNGRDTNVKIRPHQFGDDKIGELIHDLLQINPNIKLDAKCRSWLQKYDRKAK